MGRQYDRCSVTASLLFIRWFRVRELRPALFAIAQEPDAIFVEKSVDYPRALHIHIISLVKDCHSLEAIHMAAHVRIIKEG
jgi:hypothetical protein